MGEVCPHQTAIPDELVVAAQAGDAKARHELFLLIRPYVMRVLVSLVGRTRELRELRDEIALEVLLHIKSFRREAKFTTWMYSVVAQRAHAWRRRRRLVRSLRSGTLAFSREDPGARPDDLAARREEMIAASREILRLPTRMYLSLVLVDILGESPAEAAAVIGGSPRAISNASYRAKVRVRGRLVRSGFAEPARGDDPSEAASGTRGTAGSAAVGDPLEETGARHGGRT